MGSKFRKRYVVNCRRLVPRTGTTSLAALCLAGTASFETPIGQASRRVPVRRPAGNLVVTRPYYMTSGRLDT